MEEEEDEKEKEVGREWGERKLGCSTEMKERGELTTFVFTRGHQSFDRSFTK